jgi:hypothetical protein
MVQGITGPRNGTEGVCRITHLSQLPRGGTEFGANFGLVEPPRQTKASLDWCDGSAICRAVSLEGICPSVRPANVVDRRLVVVGTDVTVVSLKAVVMLFSARSKVLTQARPRAIRHVGTRASTAAYSQ